LKIISASPGPLAGFKGGLLLRRGEGRKEERREGEKGRKREKGRRRKERGKEGGESGPQGFSKMTPLVVCLLVASNSNYSLAPAIDGRMAA